MSRNKRPTHEYTTVFNPCFYVLFVCCSFFCSFLYSVLRYSLSSPRRIAMLTAVYNGLCNFTEGNKVGKEKSNLGMVRIYRTQSTSFPGLFLCKQAGAVGYQSHFHSNSPPPPPTPVEYPPPQGKEKSVGTINIGVRIHEEGKNRTEGLATLVVR